MTGLYLGDYASSFELVLAQPMVGYFCTFIWKGIATTILVDYKLTFIKLEMVLLSVYLQIFTLCYITNDDEWITSYPHHKLVDR